MLVLRRDDDGERAKAKATEAASELALNGVRVERAFAPLLSHRHIYIQSAQKSIEKGPQMIVLSVDMVIFRQSLRDLANKVPKEFRKP